MNSYNILKNFVLANCALNTRDTFKGRCSLFWPLIFKAMLSGVIQKKLQMTSYIIPKNFVLANCALGLIVLEGKDKLLPTSHHNAMVHIFDLFWTWSPYSTGQVRKWGERGNSSRFGGCVQLNQQCQNFRQRGSLVAHRARAHRLVSNLYQSRYSFPSSTIRPLYRH